jgi:hypothetical protein
MASMYRYKLKYIVVDDQSKILIMTTCPLIAKEFMERGQDGNAADC